MKYVVFEDKAGTKMPVIFPDHVTHAQVTLKGCKPVSAGFLSFSASRAAFTFGKSESLGLDSGKDDDRLLTAALQSHGIYSFI